MKFEQAKRILKIDIKKINDVNRLQRLNVQLIDAWRHSKAAYGVIEAVKNGFYKIVADSSATGYTPRDMWLTNAIENALDIAEKHYKKLYKIN